MMLSSTDLQKLCLELAPELRVHALHIAWKQHFREFQLFDRFLGATSAGLDVALECSPRGPAILLNSHAIHRWAKSLAGDNPGLSMTFNRCLCETTIHELAHVLDRRPPYFETDPEKCPGRAVLAVNMMGLDLAAVPDLAGELQAGDLASHTPQWVRIAAHLIHRGSKCGFSLTNVIHAKTYGLPPAYAVNEALADEFNHMAGWRFEEIKSASPPQAFTELFTQR